MGTLVISRKLGERVFIGNQVAISVNNIIGNQVKLGILAPKYIPIQREELDPSTFCEENLPISNIYIVATLSDNSHSLYSKENNQLTQKIEKIFYSLKEAEKYIDNKEWMQNEHPTVLEFKIENKKDSNIYSSTDRKVS